MEEIKGNFLMQLKKRDNSLEEYHFNEFEKEINEIVLDDEFKNRVLTELEILKEYGKNKWSKNEVVGTLKGANYKTTIKVGNNRVYYSVMTDTVFFRGSLHRIKDRSIIQYSEHNRESEMIESNNVLDNIVTTTKTNNKTIILDAEGKRTRQTKSSSIDKYRIRKADIDNESKIIIEKNDSKKYQK